MTSKLLAAALTGLLAIGGTVAAGPGENGQNGLCTAYFNGQKNGHENPNAGGNGRGNGRQPGEDPPPFQQVEEDARAYAGADGRDNDGDGEVDEPGEGQSIPAEEAIYSYCTDLFGEPGGNPGAGGRFGECTITDTERDGSSDGIDNDGDGEIDETDGSEDTYTERDVSCEGDTNENNNQGGPRENNGNGGNNNGRGNGRNG